MKIMSECASNDSAVCQNMQLIPPMTTGNHKNTLANDNNGSSTEKIIKY